MLRKPLDPPKSSIWAAGGVVYRHTDGQAEILVAHRPRYRDWTLPKGKLDSGETFVDAAVREVFEETGMKCLVGAELGTVAYTTPNENPKVVRYWLMDAIGGEFQPNSEVDGIKWLSFRKARAKLSYPLDRAVLNRAVEVLKRPDSGRIYLVRHALAGDRKEWKGNDRLRPLSKRGYRQALALADSLSGFPVTRVLSSSWTRCEQSVAPLAERIGVHLEPHKALREGAKSNQLIKLIRSLSGESAVLCTHGDVIKALIEKLSSRGIRLDGPLDAKKASAWVLHTRSGKIRRGSYLAPT